MALNSDSAAAMQISSDFTPLDTATSGFRPKPKLEGENFATCEPTNRENELQVIFNSSSENQINVKVDSQGEGVLEQDKIVKKKRRLRKKVNKENTKQYRSITMTNGVVFNGLSTAKQPTTGDGQLIYPDGSVFIGQIKKGQPHGHGEKVWSQANEQEGSFLKTYVGDWNNGTMEGFGELTLQQDEVYIGNFLNGYPNGQGIRKWRNGDFYEGNYVNGFQNGKGMFLS